MEELLMKLASSQGIWAVLAIFLIFFILKSQEKRDSKQEQRELNYQSLVQELIKQFALLEVVQSDIDEIKNRILK